MVITRLTIEGLRGFASEQSLDLATPTGERGSGLTMIIGPNNGGKSTIVEAFRALFSREAPSFSLGKRNREAASVVRIKAHLDGGIEYGLSTEPSEGSESDWFGIENRAGRPWGVVLPSRRYFRPYFGRGKYDRRQYAQGGDPVAFRGSSIDYFSRRLFDALDNRAGFDEILSRVVSPTPQWTIELSDAGQYFLRFTAGGHTHDSDGIGEGFVSLFFIVDALRDMDEGEVLVVDEPELSLHPSLQRKLANVLADCASSRQIVYATHSPYFLNPEALAGGAQLARAHKRDNNCGISQLGRESRERLTKLLGDMNNPHAFGLAAREAFFMSDRIVLVEGQEDVLCYRAFQEQVGISLEAELFGWGVGGASKMEFVAGALQDLGFQHVAGILDSNKASIAEKLRKEFPAFDFHVIPADDVRSKGATPEKPGVMGLADQSGNLTAEHHQVVAQLFTSINEYMQRPID